MIYGKVPVQRVDNQDLRGRMDFLSLAWSHGLPLRPGICLGTDLDLDRRVSELVLQYDYFISTKFLIHELNINTNMEQILS